MQGRQGVQAGILGDCGRDHVPTAGVQAGKSVYLVLVKQSTFASFQKLRTNLCKSVFTFILTKVWNLIRL